MGRKRVTTGVGSDGVNGLNLIGNADGEEGAAVQQTNQTSTSAFEP